jgi:thymidine kinase
MYNRIAENQGWIEVICGSMYSGKSEELIRRLKRARIARQKIMIFKPQIDTRYLHDYIVTHDQIKLEATLVSNAEEILTAAKNADVVGIDEAQFIGAGLVRVVEKLANAGKRVILAGLDMDFRGEPFHPMPHLMAIAENISKLHAICSVCGNQALFSYRTSETENLIDIGSDDKYEARCRMHFKKPPIKE